MGAIILRNDGSRVPRNDIQNLERVVSLCRIHGFLVIGQAVSLARYIQLNIPGLMSPPVRKTETVIPDKKKLQIPDFGNRLDL